MGFVCFARAILIFQLALLLLCSCTAVDATETNPPPPPSRKKVAVEGVVNCKVCTPNPSDNYRLMVQLTPIPGVKVKLACNNTNKGWEEEKTTNKKGRFIFRPQKVTTWGAHKCKVFLVSSPRSDCMSAGTPYPEDTPFKLGYPLTATATNSTSSPFQLYTTDSPLEFYTHFAACM